MNDHIVRHWLQRRIELWRDLRSLTDSHKKTRKQPLIESEKFVRRYSEVQSDLALARSELPDDRITQQLEGLLIQANQELSKPVSFLKDDLIQTLRIRLPAIMKQNIGRLCLVTAVFALSIATGWLLINVYPETAELFLSPGMIDSVQSGSLWTEGIFSITPASVISISILTNNIVVMLTAFALGALYGLGTLYIVVLNGALLGGVFAYTAEYQLDGRLGDFVVAHGCVELSIILVAAAVGLALGESIARPGDQSRADSFKQAAADGTVVCLVCIPFLIIAGFIEGYVSPSEAYTPIKVMVGVVYWLFFVGIMSGFFFRQQDGVS